MKKILAILCVSGVLAGCGGGEETLLVGVAQEDITPAFEPYQDVNGNLRFDDGEPFDDLDSDGEIKTLWLGGFGPRQPTGVHDQLSARTLVLQVGGDIFSFTSLDALGVSTGRMDAIRGRVRELLGETALSPEHMIIASTHTHQAPDTIGIFAPDSLQKGWDPDYLDLVVERAADSIRKAFQAREPAELQLAHSTCTELVRDTLDPEVSDPEVVALQALSADGRCLATLVSIANHPEAAWSENTLVSADYPGELRRRLQERFGGLVIFFAGALGLMQTPEEIAPEGFERVEAVAGAYADAIIEALLQPQRLEQPALRWLKVMATAPLEHLELRLAIEGNIAEGYFEYLYQSEEEPCASAYGCFDLPLYVFELGGLVTLITVPGELVPELLLGGILRPADSTGPYPDAPLEPVLGEHIGTPYRFVIGLAGAEIGYIYPKVEYDPDASYSYRHSAGPSAAMQIVQALCGALDELH